MSELNKMSLKGKKREGNDSNDWGGYMRSKIRKLDEQFELMKSEDEQNKVLSNLFKNVVIFVNGYTIPSSDELKKLMKNHGGGFQQYYSRTRCTHIVATNLPHSKIKELKEEKVVHPNWITDSIRQGKLLPHREYLLYGAGGKYKDTNGSKGSLMNFVKAPHGSSEVKLGSTVSKSENEPALSNMILGTSCSPECMQEPDVMRELREGTSDVNSASALSQPSSEFEEKSIQDNPGDSHYGCDATVSEDTGSSRSIDRKRSTVAKAGDANFVSEYYNHSRLHHLSTWGTEFREFINNLIQTTELKTSKRPPLKTTSKSRIIMHVDMDCFFVSVALRSRPELKGKPVAVCHASRGTGTTATTGSDNSSSFASTSEIASCSYEARSCGIKNGSWLGPAKKLCPNLVCVPYEFQQYRNVSQKLYEILSSYTHEIQAVSCDEAFIDVTHYVETDHVMPLQLAQCIRDEIKSKTDCPASAGIAPNILLARMCTRVAKPNGQFFLQHEDVDEFISNQKAKDLPGVGYSLSQKLESLNVVTCKDLQRISLPVLRREFGHKTGEMLYKYCRGEDERQLKIERERKSISAEINYAIRFQEDSEPEKFIYDLSNEVHRRMKSAGVKGKHLTFKLRVRQKDAPINPTKFMGCGRCDNISRSMTMACQTDDSATIAKECVAMLKQLGAPVSDIRGMGIQMSKLSKDNRTSSSKSIHDFMKPFRKPATTLTSDSDENSDVCTNVYESKGSTILKTVTKLPSGSDDPYESVTKEKNDAYQQTVPINDAILDTGSPSLFQMSDAVDRQTGRALEGSIDSPEKSGKDSDFENFSLVLSEDDIDEPALGIGQRETKPELGASTCVIGQRISKQDNATFRVNNSKILPPLPVFPIFSPLRNILTTSASRATSSKTSPARFSPGGSKNSSPGWSNKRSPGPSNKPSPDRSKNSSPGPSNKRSPGPSNKRSPGRSKNSSPGPSNKRSPCPSNERSPGPSNKLSPGRSPSRTQRSLDTSFEGVKSRDVVTSLLLPSPSQIDPGVFEALPDEIKKDIRSSYQQRNQKFILRSEDPGNMVKQADEVNKFPSPSQWDPEVVRCLPSELTEHLRHEYQRTDQKEVPKTKKSGARNRTIKRFTESIANPDLSMQMKVSAVPQLDASVLEAIPESLRHEVQLAYEQQRRHDAKGKQKDKNPTTIHDIVPSVVVPNRPSDDVDITIATPPLPKVSLAGAETLPEIRKMLKQWINSTKVPLDEDVSILVEYLVNLIYGKDLEKMWLVLKFYHRLVNDGKESWHMSFNTVLNSIQGVLKESYGSELSMEYFKIT